MASLLHRDKPKSSDKDSAIGDSDSQSGYQGSKLRQSLDVPDAQDAPSKAGSSTSRKASESKLSAGKTIEQSVREFKIFEALRSGERGAVLKAAQAGAGLDGTTVLHLAIQCAEPATLELLLSAPEVRDINAQDRDGNTPLHLASMLGRGSLVQLLLAQKSLDSSIVNYDGKSAMDLARNPGVFQQLQLDRAIFAEAQIQKVQDLVRRTDYEKLEAVLEDPRVQTVLDVNAPELATDQSTIETGGSLLHEAARKKDLKLIQLLLMNGADPFGRDRKGKLPQDVTKDERTRAILKKSPAATAAQRGIQEKAILGTSAADKPGGKESREFKGYLKKWVNFTSGYKLRWFVLEDGVLSYYKHQEDAGSACRGAMNMRIAQLSMDSSDRTKFEILGKSSVKYHLKANHSVEAKRWFWALNNAIQWAKDEAKDEQQRALQESAARMAISEKAKGATGDSAGMSMENVSRVSSRLPPTVAASMIEDEGDASGYGSYEPSVANDAPQKKTTVLPGEAEPDDDELDEAAEAQPAPKDAFNITAHSAGLQLDILGQVSSALREQAASKPTTTLSDPMVGQALDTYASAVQSLKSMVGDLLRIARDRDRHWQLRLDRESDMRRLWEESMTKVAKEQETLEGKFEESEDKRKRTKKALRDALEESTGTLSSSRHVTIQEAPDSQKSKLPKAQGVSSSKEPSQEQAFRRRRSTIAEYTELSDSDSEADEEFFDAVGAGEVPVASMPTSPMPSAADGPAIASITSGREGRSQEIVPSFTGYEDKVRERLAMDADDRPKISLWVSFLASGSPLDLSVLMVCLQGILKSMIGKDMTKMTLPVSFNEPTSLLQRVAEDLEYTDLLDMAADRLDSAERMVYVAAFAASEYCSTIGRVAKPFNPLLGETYEYARPDKGYRFFVEQVSHHPPIGAAWTEAPRWDYYGESAVKSKFYGKSFDINPLGTWFLCLRPAGGGEELYTWKKVTSSVIGIITGTPTVDNYGPMTVTNWSTRETCELDFKPRGWKASSAYQVAGKVVGADGRTRWSIGGHWNDKIYARLTPGYEADAAAGAGSGGGGAPLRSPQPGSSAAFLVWEAHARPAGIPFNLTPFVVTLNALPARLRPHLPPTDTRLRPDQRAMEDGAYDLAATEKNRVEEKQRAARRRREAAGEEYVPRWFTKETCAVTGEEYWKTNGEYWRMREAVGKGGAWERVEDIF